MRVLVLLVIWLLFAAMIQHDIAVSQAKQRRQSIKLRATTRREPSVTHN